MNYLKMQLLYDKKKATALDKIFDLRLKAIRENNIAKIDACADAHKLIQNLSLVQYLWQRKMVGLGKGLGEI